MSRKADYIARHGEEAYEKIKKLALETYYNNRSERQAQHRIWCKNNHLKVLEANRQRGRKGGKYYEKHLRDSQTGLRGDRNKIRCKDRRRWRKYKNFIAPDSQLHHQWVPNTAEYTGLALVEANPHRYGIIDVIQILDGKITLLTEKEICEQ